MRRADINKSVFLARYDVVICGKLNRNYCFMVIYTILVYFFHSKVSTKNSQN